MLLFLLNPNATKMDIIMYNLLENFAEVKLCNQDYIYAATKKSVTRNRNIQQSETKYIL